VRARPTDRQLLWIDITGEPGSDEAHRLADRFELDEGTRDALERPHEGPHLALHGSYVHVRVSAEPDAGRPTETPVLDVIAGGNVVISQHRTPIGFLDGFDERIKRDTNIGRLDAAALLASLLDAAVTSYFSAVDTIEDEVDELDSRSLSDQGRGRLLEDLVGVRRRIAGLRRLLATQRDLFAALAGPDVVEVVGEEAASALQAVASRFEGALGAVEDSREMLLGSFDVYMTRTAQRTNEVMKILALATVLLLPGSLIAGLLGMNVTVPLPKDDPASFWLVAGGVFLLAVSVLTVARARAWF
jgi:Mg2+ and Co2+ transporter CorA